MFRTCLTATIAAALLVPAAADAEVIVKGTGEPPFTNSANNTQWVEWSNNGNYRIEFNHHVNGGTAVVDGPYQVGRTGSTSVNWTGIRGTSVPLQEGSTYTICGFGRWDDGTGMYFPDFSTSCGDADRRGLRASTTIDRTPPTIAVALAGGAGATRTASIPMRINFSDNIAGPFPANFVCLQYGTPTGGLCDGAQGYKYLEQPNCSQPATGGRTTTFDCNLEVGAGPTPAPDGPVHACVMAADAAIPDNPNGPDQRGTSTSANRSAPKCATTVLDRVAPTAVITGPSTLKVGESALFSATVTDATTGVAAGSATFAWGDSTASVKALDATHAFAGPGVYRIRFTVADVAGNTREVTKDVTVTASTGGAPAPNPNSTPNPNPHPNPGPAPQPTPTPQPGPAPQPTTSQTPVQTATTTSALGTTSGMPTTTQPVATLKLRVLGVGRQGGRRVLRVGLPGQSGTARVTLRRGSRTVASARLPIRAGRVALRLPKRTAGGAHTVEVTLGSRTVKASVRLPGAAPRARMARTGTPEVDGRDRLVLPGA